MLVYLILCTAVLAITKCQVVEILSHTLYNVNTPFKVKEVDELLLEDKFNVQNEKVQIQVYYECLCPDCQYFDLQNLIPAYYKLKNNLDIETYPYGKAKTIIHEDGTYEIICQHGQQECYGNMLHACAKDILANNTSSILFNSCMMSRTILTGSKDNDAAADKCGELLNIDSGPIKECAKGKKGLELLKYYGDESHKVKYNSVPHVLINGVRWDDEKEQDFMKGVCQAFEEPPAACRKKIY